MNKYFTVMVIPDREKGVRSFRIPRIIFHAFLFISVVLISAISILSYDYVKILQQVYKNKHLTIENRQLKEQIQLFQMKINSLSDDIERIQTFEKKLRIITGMEDVDLSKPIERKDEQEENKPPSVEGKSSMGSPGDDDIIPKSAKQSRKLLPPEERLHINPKIIKKSKKYNNLKNLYEQKIATEFGLQASYAYTKEWTELSKQSFDLAKQYAFFDYQYDSIKSIVKSLEINVHKLDQYLLDKNSFIASTPTLLPTRGWITSYYGPRRSHYAKRIKMHEGLDIGGRVGSDIVGTADGIVTFAGKKPGFGYFVKIDHGYGVETIYAHCQSLTVKKGQKIRRGDLIAKLGSTGLSTGPHVHYEVRVNDTPVDPLYYILE